MAHGFYLGRITSFFFIFNEQNNFKYLMNFGFKRESIFLYSKVYFAQVNQPQHLVRIERKDLIAGLNLDHWIESWWIKL